MEVVQEGGMGRMRWVRDGCLGSGWLGGAMRHEQVMTVGWTNVCCTFAVFVI